MNMFNDQYPVPQEDWAFWFLRPEITAYEATALVCNLSPGWLYAERNEEGEWLFDMPEWGNAKASFERIFSLIHENSLSEGFDRPNDKINFKEFVLWVTTKTGWALPDQFKKYATKSLPEIAAENNHNRAKSSREITNELKLIGALLEVITDKSSLDTQAKLIGYLESEYKELSGFSKSHLEKKFGQSNLEFKGSKLSRDT